MKVERRIAGKIRKMNGRTLKKKNGKEGKESEMNKKTSKKGYKGNKINAKVTEEKKSGPAPRLNQSEDCLEKFIEYSKINDRKAKTVWNQVKRINSFKNILDKKKGKKGDFKTTYQTLLSALGGNKSAPECDGKPIAGHKGIFLND